MSTVENTRRRLDFLAATAQLVNTRRKKVRRDLGETFVVMLSLRRMCAIHSVNRKRERDDD